MTITYPWAILSTLIEANTPSTSLIYGCPPHVLAKFIPTLEVLHSSVF